MSEWPSIMSGMRPQQMGAGSGAPLRVLVTGFGGFPGSPKNPTARLMVELAKYRPRLARAGVHVELCVLPVIYAQAAERLAFLSEKAWPEAILHFGVAARRTKLCVETRALNRVSLLHADASGARAARREVVAKAPLSRKATVPAALIAASLRHSGFDASLSIDAGDYVCNQTLFLSLGENLAPHAPLVGFIHVPPLAARHRPRAGRLSLEAATRAAAVAILALTPKLRLRRLAWKARSFGAGLEGGPAPAKTA